MEESERISSPLTKAWILVCHAPHLSLQNVGLCVKYILQQKLNFVLPAAPQRCARLHCRLWEHSSRDDQLFVYQDLERARAPCCTRVIVTPYSVCISLLFSVAPNIACEAKKGYLLGFSFPNTLSISKYAGYIRRAKAMIPRSISFAIIIRIITTTSRIKYQVFLDGFIIDIITTQKDNK
jgi:hypothetical protein